MRVALLLCIICACVCMLRSHDDGWKERKEKRVRIREGIDVVAGCKAGMDRLFLLAASLPAPLHKTDNISTVSRNQAFRQLFSSWIVTVFVEGKPYHSLVPLRHLGRRDNRYWSDSFVESKNHVFCASPSITAASLFCMRWTICFVRCYATSCSV